MGDGARKIHAALFVENSRVRCLSALEPDRHNHRDADAPRPIAWRRVLLENEILSVLEAAPDPGETVALAFARKEHELVGLFRTLDVREAMELHRRLSLSLSTDPIARQFKRLVVERRVRLMSFLAGARRREALRHAC